MWWLHWADWDWIGARVLYSLPVTIQRLRVYYYDVYRAWRYPQTVEAVAPDAAVLGEHNLVVLDETAAEIRPRIKLAALGLPTTFEALHVSLPEGLAFVQLAREANHKFDAMETLSTSRNPLPTLEQARRTRKNDQA